MAPPSQHLASEEAARLVEEACKQAFADLSVFGRLIGIAAVCRRLHKAAFRDWLSLPLCLRKDDLADYLEVRDGEPEALSALLVAGQHAIPAECEDAERQLFLTDLKMLQTLLADETRRGARPLG